MEKGDLVAFAVEKHDHRVGVVINTFPGTHLSQWARIAWIANGIIGQEPIRFLKRLGRLQC